MRPSAAPACAEVDLDAYRHNLALARRAAGKRRVFAVIKADGYGHGALALAQAGGADGFVLARLEEAITLRTAGVEAPMVALQGAFAPEDFSRAAEARVALAVHDASQVTMLERAPALPPEGVELWVKVETGMHRLGLAPAELDAVRARLAAHGGARVTTLISHLACADEPEHAQNASQIEAFQALGARLGLARSLANSGALLGGLAAGDDVVRPGIMLYGASPLLARSAAELGLRAVMRLTARLVAVKTVPEGGSVGYGASWSAPEPTRIGVVTIGYGDGYPRHAPVGTPVWLRGRRVGILGRVSMDSLAVDLSAVPEAATGEEVELWGPNLAVDEVAERVGTIAYELLTKVTPRVARRYVGRVA